ncbi:hypothetical protein VNO77_34687 [Canavalia gladiata]|uniref:Uncharacterized protein n=1 Tax=Canavalia gladiata TaxID=3824 RepID=A0AAN9KGS6_CANGL
MHWTILFMVRQYRSYNFNENVANLVTTTLNKDESLFYVAESEIGDQRKGERTEKEKEFRGILVALAHHYQKHKRILLRIMMKFQKVDLCCTNSSLVHRSFVALIAISKNGENSELIFPAHCESHAMGTNLNVAKPKVRLRVTLDKA